MRITVFGGSGLLGQALAKALGVESWTAPSSKDVDIRDPGVVEAAIRQSRPDWIILAAAYTDVDGCESNRGLAFAVNCESAVNVASAAKSHEARLMFLSTDYVFDGTKQSPYEVIDSRNPINVYGETKARAEERILQVLPDACIVRTSWLFGPGGQCFPATILKLARTRQEISVVNDQRGCPTYTHDLAPVLVELCRKSANGIVHATNSGDCTWYEFASEIVRDSGLPATVKPVSSAEFPRPARRPTYSVLSTSSLELHGIHMPKWQDALHRYLRSPLSP